MRITVVAVGRLKEPHWRSAADEYLKRLKPYAQIEVIEVPDRDVSADEARALAREAEGVARAIPSGDRLVVLDVAGGQMSSEGLAEWLGGRRVSGGSRVTFVLGGAAGLASEVSRRADERLSLSAMTLPHQLARVVLLEQLYRAFRILAGEPYHR